MVTAMLAHSTVQRVKQLLAEGSRPRREVARIAGVNRNTVDAIALGRRIDRPPAAAEESEERPPQWCRGCGAMVVLPCRLCQVRRLLAMGRLTPAPPQTDDPLRLDLKPNHRRRYEQVVARRRRMQEKQNARRSSAHAGPRKLAARLRLKPASRSRRKRPDRDRCTSEE